ncbi:hypothetical protein CSKR_107753 [Clonorchis sinensis]|uniref:Uncharacterized protein n=1 Tax=Clonorchis sinensis TaxID=79923 RepID=A0A3R7CKV6_CLOSI|nr:hypothetical protein CSKR_107753 [Clonorchis sinensis]
MSRRKLRKTLRTVTTAWNYGSSSTATYKGTGSQLRHFVKMGEQMSLKIAYVIALIVAGVLGIVALGLNDNFGKSSVSRVRCSDAFTVIAVILLLASAILFLVVMFLKTDAARIILIVTFVAAAVGLVSYIIACSCLFQAAPGYPAWLLSALWVSIAAVAISITFIFNNPLE